MTDNEITFRKLFQKYGEYMAAREVMRELEIGGTRKLSAIPVDDLPKSGGGRQGVKICYLTSDVAEYLIKNPPRRSRGYHVELDARELSRFFARHRLSPEERARVMDAWSTAIVFGDESADIDISELSVLSGCDVLLLKALAERGVPLNPLRTGVFVVAA